MTVKKAIARLQGRGQLDSLREDLAQQKAVDLLVERAKVISVEDARRLARATPPPARSRPRNPASGRSSAGRVP